MRRKCVALFSYAPQHEDELALAVGDSVDFIEEVEEGWWRGSHQGKIGVFPSNFVSVPTEVSEAKSSPSSNLGATKALPSTATPTPGNLPISEARNAANVSQIEVLTPVEDTSAPSLPPKPVREMARALFPYASQHPDELELNEGDMVVILSKECEDKGWWKGQLNGKIGVFPDNFVELIVVPAAASSPIKPARPERPPEKPIGLIQPTATLSSTSPAVPMALSSVSASKPISVPDKTEALTRKESTSSLPSQTLYKSVSAGSFPKLSISPTPTSLPKAPLSAGISNAKVQDVDLDSLITDKSTNLQHLTTSRPAGPKRRPPSSYIKDQDVTIATENTPPKVNGYSAANEEPNNNIEENDGLIRPQKEKNVTPPWLKELSEKQENRISKMAVKDESVIDNTVGKLAGINKPTVPVQKPEDKPYIPLKPSSVSANKVTHPSPPVTKTQKSVSGKLPAAPMIGGPLVAATSQNVALSSNPEELQKEVLSLRGEVDTLKSEVRSLQHSLGGMQQSLSGVLSEMSVLRRILQDQGFGSSII
ncbi:hypothetical protein QYM36_006941 [Artemia franciscana]|nr:hypothetical protein QYM36_006941 [Artemia franciscana]